jgi:gas vesicle protein
MERIAEKLSEIEMTARSIVDGAQEQKHQMEMKMQKQRDTFDADMEKETNEKILKIQADLATNMENLLKKQEEQNNNEIEVLKQDFKEHRSEYARQILERVIKV